MAKKEFFRLPVVSAGAEFLVMGYLMRRNILAYKAPPNNEGYDLICIHPDPRHRPTARGVAAGPGPGEKPYATDCDRGFPVKEAVLDAFDFLIVAFLNIGKFFWQERRLDRRAGAGVLHAVRTNSSGSTTTPVLPGRRSSCGTWKPRSSRSRTESGFELIAKALGVPRPRKPPRLQAVEDEGE